MKAQEQKKPDLKTRQAAAGQCVLRTRWQACVNLFVEQREPIHVAACEAERRFGMKDACELSRWLPARARGAGFLQTAGQ